MYKLYYSSGACSMAPHIVLNELGVPFEAVKLNMQAGDNQKPEFLKINPLGAVPTLVTGDGQVVREGAAILITLLERHQSPLLPQLSKNGGKDRAEALEWLCFANATLHPAYGKMFFILKNVTDKAVQEQLFKTALEQTNKLWAILDAKIGQNPYICGKELTVADILVTVIANWGSTFPTKVTLGPNVKRLIKEVIKRPSYQEALKTEEVEYKAAA